MLKDVSETKMGLATRGALRIQFGFRSEYTPELAVLNMEGEAIMLVDAKQSENILMQFKKSRQMPREIAEPVMNFILDRCNIQALLLAKDLTLPSPVPLPKVRVEGPVAGKTEPKKEEPVKTTKVKKGK